MLKRENIPGQLETKFSINLKEVLHNRNYVIVSILPMTHAEKKHGCDNNNREVSYYC